MNKTQVWEAAQVILKSHKANATIVEAMKVLLAPKTNISEYMAPKDDTRFCRVLRKYIDVNDFTLGELNYENTNSKNCASRPGYKAQKKRKDAIGLLNLEIQTILTDILDEEITPQEGKLKRKEIISKIQKLEVSPLV